MTMAEAPKVIRDHPERQRLEVHRDDGTTIYADRHILVAVGGARPGIRVDLTIGVDGKSVYLEAYHWEGRERQPIEFQTLGGVTIDTQPSEGRPHPELVIVEVAT